MSIRRVEDVVTSVDDVQDGLVGHWPLDRALVSHTVRSLGIVYHVCFCCGGIANRGGQYDRVTIIGVLAFFADVVESMMGTVMIVLGEFGFPAISKPGQRGVDGGEAGYAGVASITLIGPAVGMI
jgi:hypothetical protein